MNKAETPIGMVWWEGRLNPDSIINLPQGGTVAFQLWMGRTNGDCLEWLDEKPIAEFIKHGGDPGLRPVLKHPGHPDQKVHGRRGASAKHIAQAAETGEHLGVGVPVPEELQGAFDYATGRSRPFNGDEEERLEFLREKAHEWANKNGFPDDDYPYSDMTSAQIYAAAVVRRAMDKKAQDERWSETSDADAEKVKQVFDDWRADGKVMVRVPSEHLDEILADRVLTQFDTGESRGLLNHDLRAITETAAFDIHPAVDAWHRPVYGFIGKEGSESPLALGQYGDVTLVLKDSVRERTTVTLGDSLNTTATPVPLLGAVTARQVSDASAVTIFGDVPRHVARSGSASLDDGAMYMEAQIHVGGVRKTDISRIIFSDYGDLNLDFVSDLADSLVADGIEVDIDYSD